MNKENATRVWTISLAVVAILIVIGVCIYYMTNPKVNKSNLRVLKREVNLSFLSFFDTLFFLT